jgi:DNA-directed RNA polymerase specialized sigma24 family protein
VTSYTPPLSDAYLQYLAKWTTQNQALHDDLVQEGRIRVWQAWQKEPGKPRQYYVVAVKRRMMGLCMGVERFTGHAGRRGYVDAMSPKHKAPEALAALLEDPAFDEQRLRPAIAPSKVMKTADLKAAYSSRNE